MKRFAFKMTVGALLLSFGIFCGVDLANRGIDTMQNTQRQEAQPVMAQPQSPAEAYESQIQPQEYVQQSPYQTQGTARNQSQWQGQSGWTSQSQLQSGQSSPYPSSGTPWSQTQQSRVNSQSQQPQYSAAQETHPSYGATQGTVPQSSVSSGGRVLTVEPQTAGQPSPTPPPIIRVVPPSLAAYEQNSASARVGSLLQGAAHQSIKTVVSIFRKITG